MGWFSGKKKVIVSSVVYNLAGGPESRIRYLPSAIVMKIVSNNNFSMAETVQGALLNGPGMRMRNFARWSREQGYTAAIGQDLGELIIGTETNATTIITQIPVGPNQEITIQDIDVGSADYGRWADQWMLENHPDQVDDNYIIDFDEVANIIYIRFETNPTIYSFQPVDFDITAQYLYVGYTITTIDTKGPVIPGSLVIVGSPAGYPSTDGWQHNGNSSDPKSTELTTVVTTEITYSDDTPSEFDTTETTKTQEYFDILSEYEKTDFLGSSPDGSNISSLRHIMNLMQIGYVTTVTNTTTDEETLPGDVIKTTKTTTLTDVIQSRYAYRIDDQSIIDRDWSVLQSMIYKQGSGNPVLDAQFVPSTKLASFFPFIPIRNDNRFLSESYFPELYALNKKALKRATGSGYDALVDSLADNESLGDIDYAYVSFGVALNTKEDSSKKYIYKFFQAMLNSTGGGADEYNSWRAEWNTADLSQRLWLSWKEAQSDPASPLYGNPEPTKLPYPTQWGNSVNIRSAVLSYDMKIYWSSITEITGTGQAWDGARTGQVRIQIGASDNYDQLLVSAGLVSWIPLDHEFMEITWQDSNETWRTLGVWNCWHSNAIYKGKAVYTGASEAVLDPEESGFIIPMHEGIFRSMSLKDTSQMSMANSYMVLNCYDVVKQKWYQTSWFKIVLVIIVIVITVLSSGTGAGSAGLLGTAASVGAAVGLAGLAAIIVGTVINTLAAMLLTQLIMAGSTALFGEKVGAIVGAIASVIAVSAGSAAGSGQSMASSFSSLASAENLIKLSVAAGNGFAGYINAGNQDIIAKTQDLLDQYESQATEISKLWEQNLGYGITIIDPMMLTDVAPPQMFIPESSNVFLSRTLMTGADIADLTNGMLTNFVAMTISTDLPS